MKLLGLGGSSKVYLAEHIKLKSYRAIKYIPKHHPMYKLQLKEAQILKDLKHSCIPIVYDIEEDKDGSYIIEQYLEGITLKEYVKNSNCLNKDVIIHFALQLCDLIRYLHSVKRPILYLDLKPENIIVSGMKLMLIDFGSAIFRDEADKFTEFYATVGYAAPELYRNSLADERCDVYGIGILLYFMATGKVLEFDTGLEHIDFSANIDKKLKRVISRCLRYNPSQRYASVARLEKDLLEIGKKKKFKIKSGSSVEIGIAGAQKRIGTTHMAFRLCNYFIAKNISCLYIEQNDSRCIWQIKNRYYDLKGDQGVIKFKGIPMVSHSDVETADLSEYNIIIRDYGNLDMKNKEDFLNSHIKILVLGAKDWELGFSEDALEIITEYKDIIFLFNFLNGKQFGQIIKHMPDRNCMRIPYEPDPFAMPKDKVSKEFFTELVKICTEEVAN
ncbi:serine/threonine-protein kinase [Herbinix hemicellulosilytica]|uniref:serine/threonine-protein kinase n=1 Tax=Herbinix hemicellulosilytica TaxID=1564487 RepID=UPI00241E3335|nr:serine/threonine-protein kinase [Herbinix hemicellulosilytica]